MLETFLIDAWFLLLIFTVALFVILAGADLGIGVLMLVTRDEKERSSMVAAIGPLWYANETWLVIAGAVLFGAFPLAYGLLFSALYIPTMALIFGLIFRAVATEFRVHSARKRLWGNAFGVGSLVAILGQGFVLGGLLSELRVSDGEYVGGAWDWLSAPSIIVAAGMVAGFSMLGAAWVVRRTTGEYLPRTRRILRASAWASAALFIATIVVLPFVSPPISRVWLQPPHPLISAIFFAGTLFGFAMMLRSIPRQTREAAPYAWGVVAFTCATLAVLSAIFPYFVPTSVTIAQAAAPIETLVFMLFGVGAVVPIAIVYNLYARGVFKGKVRGTGEEEYR